MAQNKVAAKNKAQTTARRTATLWRRWRTFSLALSLLVALAAGGVRATLQIVNTPPERGARGAGVKPKRSVGRGAKQTRSATAQTGAAAANAPVGDTALQAESVAPVLATADFDLIGLAVSAGPVTQTVPKNTPTAVLAQVQVPEGSDPTAITAGLNPNYRVRGELTGPSLTAPLTIEAPLGQALSIPPLARAGEHVLQNLRVVDTGAADAPTVAPVTPDACGIVVIERLLVSEVHVQELTYDQIVQAGISLTDDSYTAFNFTLGLATDSLAQTINIPVALP